MTESELKSFLKAGESDICVKLSVTGTTNISKAVADKDAVVAYTLQGTVAQSGQRGIVIENGKKIIR